ncbi:MAG: mechanosensitive ion channel family protein [Candidatus Acidiferrales bacterium]
MFLGINVRELLPTSVAIVGVLALMWVALWLATRAIRRMAQRLEEEDREHMEEIERWARQLTRFVRRSIEAVAGVAALFILLRGLGLRGIRRLEWEQVADWWLGPGLRILLVLGGAFVLSRILHLLLARLPLFVVPREGPLAEVLEREKRANTITRTLRMLTTAVVMSVAVLIVIRELGVDITPILTGAGIAGLAVGFGAQNLVRDIISGFFLIMENQVRVGDVAIINGKGGLVEALRLRTIQLRGLDGTVHVFPNGAISELSNLTKDFSYYVIDVGVAYKENVDRVMGVLRQIGEELQREPAYAERILAPLEILGVDSFADSAVVIRIRIKTLPLQQWNVGRELRRRIKNTFDAQGIEIPYPHLSLYFGEASKPFAVQVAEELGKRPGGPSGPPSKPSGN